MSEVDDPFAMTKTAATEMAELLLEQAAGLDVTTEHGKDTAERFVRMLKELTTPKEFEFRVFDSKSTDMIVVRSIPFTSLCNHHVVPFIGKADIAYIPNGKIAGLSKFARAVHYFAKSLQIQERLTDQIANFLEEKLKPEGVAVVLEAEHMCMTIRGVQAPGTLTYTAAMRGAFADHTRTAKMEFLSRINGRVH